MVSVPFDPSRELIYIGASISGPRGTRTLQLALDTGCSETLIIPEIIDDIGYNARAGTSITSVTSPLGKEYGYRLRVARFEALGHALDDRRVRVHDLDDDCGIDGLLGLDFLRRFNYEIRSAEGRILIAPVEAAMGR